MQTSHSIPAHKKTHRAYTGETKAASFFQPLVQAKLKIDSPGSVHEQEGDAMADQVMRTPANEPGFFKPAATMVQRKCSHCEKEEQLQKKEGSGGTVHPADTSQVQDVISSKGQPLDKGTRNFMESRFGNDFSNVQVHTDTGANWSAAGINARAYTSGNHIAFASGEYQPQTDTGKHLLAHELTHVVQQKGQTAAPIQRSVNGNSRCSTTVDPAAPPRPLTFIILADMLAGSHLSWAITSMQLDLMSSSRNGKLSGNSFDAYRSRFGDPPAVRRGFRNRFDNSTHPDIAAAQEAEMRSLIARLRSVQRLLDSGITYRCTGNGRWKVNDDFTFSRCGANTLLKAPIADVHAIAICPSFWNDPASDDQGISIIHELFHIRFQYPDHDTTPAATSAQRLREPQCYAGFVADVNNVSSTDASCPTI